MASWHRYKKNLCLKNSFERIIHLWIGWLWNHARCLPMKVLDTRSTVHREEKGTNCRKSDRCAGNLPITRLDRRHSIQRERSGMKMIFDRHTLFSFSFIRRQSEHKETSVLAIKWICLRYQSSPNKYIEILFLQFGWWLTSASELNQRTRFTSRTCLFPFDLDILSRCVAMARTTSERCRRRTPAFHFPLPMPQSPVPSHREHQPSNVYQRSFGKSRIFLEGPRRAACCSTIDQLFFFCFSVLSGKDVLVRFVH